MNKKTPFLSIICMIILSLTGTTNAQQTGVKHPIKINMPVIKKAVAVITPTKGNNVHGIVTFTKTENGIKVVADLEGLTPGAHGFHIHEYGDCSAANGSSAGGHFNPDSVKHAGPLDVPRHVGDMGNITADKNGKAHIELVDNLIAFQGTHNIIGHAVVVHANADDLKSQPSGNAGPRVACGVIGIAESE